MTFKIDIEDHQWDAKLCYINSEVAYFTTQDLDKQWGDDWNDAPYEHNAGDPYYGKEYDIVTACYCSLLETPAQLAFGNSHYSVEQINQKSVAWLAPDRWNTNPKLEPIFAGVTLREFCEKIMHMGGIVYLPIKEENE